MSASHVEVVCYGGVPTDPGDVQTATGTIDLGSAPTFLAWTSIGYINGLSGPWDFDNAVAAEIYQVDGNVVPYDTWNGKLGPEGALTNLHQMSYIGYRQTITFRLRVFQPEEMEVGLRGIVLTGI